MSKSKSNALLLSFTVMLTGLFSTSLLQAPQVAFSQTDYELYIIPETSNKQKINQQNIASGSSTNINCGTNMLDSSQQLVCPRVPPETPTPGTTVVPVVTQRVANISTIVDGITSGEAQCNPDEVVTGGGYDIPMSILIPPPNTTVLKEFAADNAWHVEVSDVGVFAPMKIFAECLKLVPS